MLSEPSGQLTSTDAAFFCSFATPARLDTLTMVSFASDSSTVTQLPTVKLNGGAGGFAIDAVNVTVSPDGYWQALRSALEVPSAGTSRVVHHANAASPAFQLLGPCSKGQ